MLKKDVQAFMDEFHQREKLSKGIGASFIVLIPKKSWEIGIRDYRPINLLGSIYKTLTKVLAGILQKALPGISPKNKEPLLKGGRFYMTFWWSTSARTQNTRTDFRGSFASWIWRRHLTEWTGSLFNICSEEWGLEKNGERVEQRLPS